MLYMSLMELLILSTIWIVLILLPFVSDRIYEILLQACLPDLRTGKNQVSPQKLLQFNRKNLGGKNDRKWKMENY